MLQSNFCKKKKLENARDIAPFVKFLCTVFCRKTSKKNAYSRSSSNGLIRLKDELLCVAEKYNLIFIFSWFDSQIC